MVRVLNADCETDGGELEVVEVFALPFKDVLNEGYQLFCSQTGRSCIQLDPIKRENEKRIRDEET